MVESNYFNLTAMHLTNKQKFYEFSSISTLPEKRTSKQNSMSEDEYCQVLSTSQGFGIPEQKACFSINFLSPQGLNNQNTESVKTT
jgi:hypothetical protein